MKSLIFSFCELLNNIFRLICSEDLYDFCGKNKLIFKIKFK